MFPIHTVSDRVTTTTCAWFSPFLGFALCLGALGLLATIRTDVWNFIPIHPILDCLTAIASTLESGTRLFPPLCHFLLTLATRAVCTRFEVLARWRPNDLSAVATNTLAARSGKTVPSLAFAMLAVVRNIGPAEFVPDGVATTVLYARLGEFLVATRWTVVRIRAATVLDHKGRIAVLAALFPQVAVNTAPSTLITLGFSATISRPEIPVSLTGTTIWMTHGTTSFRLNGVEMRRYV